MNTADAVCDRVAFIVDGRVSAIDAPRALRHRFGKRQVEVRWEAEDGSVARELFSMDGLHRSERFLELLRAPGLAAIHSQEATLEDVFVEVTGRALR